MICIVTIYLNVRQLKPLGLKAIELARFYCIHTSRQLIRSLVSAKDLKRMPIETRQIIHQVPL